MSVKRLPLLVRRACRVILTLGLACGACPLGAEEVTSDRNSKVPIAYRRIFVPADNVDSWPRDGQKYLPVEAREFEAWVAEANRGATASGPDATISEAVYRARLDGQQLVDGRGQWTIVVRGERPALLKLDGLSLAVSEARWRDDVGQPVRLGMWGDSGGVAARLGLEARRSGVLDFHWRVPIQTAAGNVTTAWRLPQATITRLVLDLPDGKRPVWEGSLVVRSENLPLDDRPTANETVRGQTTSVPPVKPVARRRWELIAGPAAQSTLSVEDERAPIVAPAPTLLVDEEISYRITERGLDMETRLRLDGVDRERRQLSIVLPTGVQLVSASESDRELTWRLTSDGPAATTKAIVQLPEQHPEEPATNTITVVVRCWQALATGAEWRLPVLRPDDAFWTSGLIQVSLSPRMELQSLQPIDCRQTAAHFGATAPGDPETSSFVASSPAAGLDVVIGRRAADAAVRVGTTIEMRNVEVAGRSVARIDVARGRIHTLFGDMPSAWSVEAVETIPRDALGEWYVDERKGRRQIEVQLTGAAHSERSVSVIVTGRLQPRSLEEPLALEPLRMVRWLDAQVVRDLMLVQAIDPYEVEAVGELPLAATQALTDSDRTLISSAADGRLFDLAAASPSAAVRRTVKRGQFSAEVQVDAEFAGADLRETYRLVLRPRTNLIEQVLVFSTVPLDEDVRWTERSSGLPLAAVPVADGDPRRANLPPAGQLWQVRLPRPQSKRLEIDAAIVKRSTSTTSIALVSLPEATEQDGRVLIRVANPRQTPLIEARGLQAVPLPQEWSGGADGENETRVWAAYRYQPADCQDRVRQPEIDLLAPANPDAAGPVVARRVKLESYFSASGEAVHRATFQLENPGRTVSVPMPPSGRLISYELNGRTQAFPGGEREKRPLVIELPSARRTELSLNVATRQEPLAAGSKLLPPPQLEGVSVVTGEWTIWVPEQFAVLGLEAAVGGADNGWRQRLFGPLGRPAGAPLFDPLRGGTWAGSVARWSEESPSETTASGDAVSSPLLEAAPGLDVNSDSPSQKIQPTGAVPVSKPPLAGWRSYRRMIVAGVPQSVVLAHPSATSTWSMAIFLLFMFGGWMLGGQRREWFIGVTSAAAVLCLLLPDVYAPLATGAFLGLLASLTIGWLPLADAIETPTRTWTQRSVTGAMGVAGLILLGNSAMAQFSPPGKVSATGKRPTIERVLIPVDSARRQVGTKLYVSAPFLRELLRDRAEHFAASGDWLIKAATLRGELRQSADNTELTAGNWSIAIEIEVLARDTTVRLPLVRGEATWPATIELDGVPLPLEWDSDGRNATVTVAEPGRYQLAISFTPAVHEDAGRRQIALTVLPPVGVGAELAHPADVKGLELEGAIGAGVDGGDKDLWRGHLDGSGRLVVRWQPPDAPAREQDLPLTELRWLRIGADGAEMEVKYLAPQDAQLPSRLVMSADHRWVLVTSDEGWEQIGVSEETDGRQGVQVTLLANDVERGEATFRWRLTGSAAIGRLPLPYMALTSPQTGPCWLGVSSAPSMECEIAEAETMTTETGEEFMRLWGGDESSGSPELAVSNLAPGKAVSVAIRPRPSESAVDEVMHVAAGAEALRIQYQADVVPGDSTRFGFALTAPAGLVIEQVAVTQAGRPIEVRWARQGERRVNVFYAEELVDHYRLVLTAHVPTTGAAESELPRVVAAGEEPAVERVHVYREEPVQVKVLGPIAVDDAAPDLPPTAWNARLLGVYQLDPEVADRVRLSISPNRVETIGETLTTLERRKESWWATFNGRITVGRGELDSLRLRVPTEWPGPYEVQPTGTIAVVTATSDAEHGILSLRLRESVATGQSLAFEIGGPLQLAAGANVAVPEIAPENAGRWRNYVSVPTGLDSQSLTWTGEGVRPARPPANLRPSAGTPSDVRSYRVTSTPYRVVLAPPKMLRPSPAIRLADTTVVRGPGGNLLLATRLIVAPHGLDECELALAEGQELVSAHLDGQQARIRRLDGGRWAVSLGPPNLPQILDIVSRDVRRRGMGNRRVELTRAQLLANGVPISVEMSLWSFGERSLSGPVRVEGASLVTDVDQSALRLDRLVSIAEGATPTAVGLPPADGYDWYRPWAEQLLIAQVNARSSFARLRRESSASQVSLPSEEQLGQASERIDNWIERCYELLNWPDFGPPIDLAPAYADHGWPPASDRMEGWIHCVADGTSDRLVVKLSAADAPGGRAHYVGAMAIACLAAAGVWLVRQRAAGDALRRWPHAVGVLGGLFWWAWLWPSWLGVVIGAASLWPLFRPGWPGRAIRSDGSTVLQTSRSH